MMTIKGETNGLAEQTATYSLAPNAMTLFNVNKINSAVLRRNYLNMSFIYSFKKHWEGGKGLGKTQLHWNTPQAFRAKRYNYS